MGEIGTLANAGSVYSALSAEMRRRTNNSESTPAGFFLLTKTVSWGADDVANFSTIGDRVNFFTLPRNVRIIGGSTLTPDIESVTANSLIGLMADGNQLTIGIVGTAAKTTYLDTNGTEEVHMLGNVYDAGEKDIYLEITNSPGAFNSDAPKEASVTILVYVGEEITI